MQLGGFVVLALVTAAVADPAKLEDARKTSSIQKVVELLADLKAKVTAEGDAEAKTYDTFACFCKDMQAEKTEAIQQGQDAKETLTAEIGKKQSEREELDTTLEETAAAILELEKEIADAQAAREKEHKAYVANEADLAGAVEALEGAIQVLKAAKPSLVQIRAIAGQIQAATLMADAMGLTTEEDRKKLSFVQGVDVPTEDYTFHSDSVIETLEKLLVDFKKQHADLEEAETAAVAEHDKIMQEKETDKKKKEEEVEEAEKKKAEVTADIATASESLTAAAAELLDDQKYMKQLMKTCSTRAKTWDQRSQARADELGALTSALNVIEGLAKSDSSAPAPAELLAQQGVTLHIAASVARNEDAMAKIEAQTEEEFPSFLQRGSLRSLLSGVRPVAAADGGRQLVIHLLRSLGKDLRSPRISTLAETISEDKFAKVKKLIEELIERLLKEAGEEATQKGWCDKAMADAEGKRDRASEGLKELNAGLAAAEAEMAALTEELEKLATEIEELKEAKAKAEKMREAEKAENEADIADAKDGAEAIGKAIKILKDFYAKSGEAKVELVQRRGVDDDAPDAGFKDGETYKGAVGAAGGIIGMLEVIEADFNRVVTETEQAEAAAAQEFTEFMRTTKTSLAAKETAEANKKKYKDDLQAKITEDTEALETQTTMLVGAIKELIELKPACTDTGMSYEDRVALRNEEIEGLKKALCILENYEKYGPNAGGGDC